MNGHESQDFFTTFEYKCIVCKNWKIHQVLSSTTEFIENSHSTCTCDVINHGTVCCPLGLKLLLNEQPELTTKIKFPPMYTTLTMLLKQNSSAKLYDDKYVFVECKKIMYKSDIT